MQTQALKNGLSADALFEQLRKGVDERRLWERSLEMTGGLAIGIKARLGIGNCKIVKTGLGVGMCRGWFCWIFFWFGMNEAP